MKTAYFSILLLALTACSGGQRQETDKTAADTETSPSANGAKVCRIDLLPYGDFTAQETKRLKRELEQNLTQIVPVDIKILPAEPLPHSAYYKPRNRYRAGEILNVLKRRKKPGEGVTIGLTHKDISTTIHGTQDFGIMGYSHLPGNAAVCSTFRLKRRADLCNLVIHEFLHAVGFPHCETAGCYMQDAHGKNVMTGSKSLCRQCQPRLKQMKY